MLSKYLRTLEKDGVVAVFHELSPSPIFLKRQIWNTVVSSGLIPLYLQPEFISKGLLIQSESEDVVAFKKAEKYLLSKLSHVTILYLMTAQGCDFNCGYCPVPRIAKRFGESKLSTQAARAGIDLWLKHHDTVDDDRDHFVIFYGGEPLLNKEVIYDALEYLDCLRNKDLLPVKIHYMVATNGVGVDDRFIEACIRYDVSVAVGLDGDKNANDAMKVDLRGNPTYDRIISVIHRLVRAGIQTYSSCSITPFNIDSIHEMSAFFKNLGVKKFGFNFLKGQNLIDLVGIDGVEDYYRRASRAVITNARTQCDAGFESQMEKKALAYFKGDYFPLDCTCYGSQLVVQPDGQISNCPFYKARLGDVCSVGDTFRIGEQSIVHKWRQRLPLYHDGIAKMLSGGGCVSGLLDQHNNKLITDIGSQIFAEEVLNEFVWNTYRTQ